MTRSSMMRPIMGWALASATMACAAIISSIPAAAQFVQQGTKLVGSSADLQNNQGNSVALSADGNTAVVGGPDDNDGIGSRGFTHAPATPGRSRPSSRQTTKSETATSAGR